MLGSSENFLCYGALPRHDQKRQPMPDPAPVTTADLPERLNMRVNVPETELLGKFNPWPSELKRGSVLAN